MRPRKAIGLLRKLGHIDFPRGRRQDAPKTDDKLTLETSCVRTAVQSIQESDVNFDFLSQMYYGEPCEPNGKLGPVTEMYLKLRVNSGCGHADYLNESEIMGAMGTGNWKGCHGVGNFHCVKIYIANSPPSWLAPHFEEIKKRVTDAYAETGLLVLWDGTAQSHNIHFSFVSGSTGWIGLAIVSNNSTCTSSPIWCRYLNSYRGGSSIDQWITQWVTLIKHELGHNCGEGHHRGGVMNSTIVNGLPTSFRNDPTWGVWVRKFGGVTVPRTPDEIERKQYLVWKYSDGKYEDILEVPRYVGDGGGWPVNI